MIVVRVELWAARDGSKRELARMHICNTGESAGRRRNYFGKTFIGRTTNALDRKTVSKEGSVEDYPAESLHVWNLVRRMLAGMGYVL